MRPLLVAINRVGARVWSREEHGQDLLEYGVLVALIALVALAAVGTAGRTIYTVFWSAIGASV